MDITSDDTESIINSISQPDNITFCELNEIQSEVFQKGFLATLEGSDYLEFANLLTRNNIKVDVPVGNIELDNYSITKTAVEQKLQGLQKIKEFSKNFNKSQSVKENYLGCQQISRNQQQARSSKLLEKEVISPITSLGENLYSMGKLGRNKLKSKPLKKPKVLAHLVDSEFGDIPDSQSLSSDSKGSRKKAKQRRREFGSTEDIKEDINLLENSTLGTEPSDEVESDRTFTNSRFFGLQEEGDDTTLDSIPSSGGKLKEKINILSGNLPIGSLISEITRKSNKKQATGKKVGEDGTGGSHRKDPGPSQIEDPSPGCSGEAGSGYRRTSLSATLLGTSDSSSEEESDIQEGVKDLSHKVPCPKGGITVNIDASKIHIDIENIPSNLPEPGSSDEDGLFDEATGGAISPELVERDIPTNKSPSQGQHPTPILKKSKEQKKKLVKQSTSVSDDKVDFGVSLDDIKRALVEEIYNNEDFRDTIFHEVIKDTKCRWNSILQIVQTQKKMVEDVMFEVDQVKSLPSIVDSFRHDLESVLSTQNKKMEGYVQYKVFNEKTSNLSKFIQAVAQEIKSLQQNVVMLQNNLESCQKEILSLKKIRKEHELSEIISGHVGIDQPVLKKPISKPKETPNLETTLKEIKSVKPKSDNLLKKTKHSSIVAEYFAEAKRYRNRRENTVEDSTFLPAKYAAVIKPSETPISSGEISDTDYTPDEPIKQCDPILKESPKTDTEKAKQEAINMIAVGVTSLVQRFRFHQQKISKNKIKKVVKSLLQLEDYPNAHCIIDLEDLLTKKITEALINKIGEENLK